MDIINTLYLSHVRKVYDPTLSKQIIEETSKLTMQIIFKSVTDRDNLLKMPFARGINMAHNQLQKVISKIK